MSIRTNDAKRSHMAEPRVENGRIVSGDESTNIAHNNDYVAIGEADDGTLWVLVHDQKCRPRGRDPGIVVELGDVHYEQNGLVRVVNKRVARDSLERFVKELTGQTILIGSDLGRRTRIPEGCYGGIAVQHVDGSHYRVEATGSAAKHMAEMQPLNPSQWLVMAGEESLLRRQLVKALMPVHHRMIWAGVRHGEKVLLVTGVVFAGVTLLAPSAAPFALLSAIALGVFRWKQPTIVAFSHRVVVRQHIALTFEPVSAEVDESGLVVSKAA